MLITMVLATLAVAQDVGYAERQLESGDIASANSPMAGRCTPCRGVIGLTPSNAPHVRCVADATAISSFNPGNEDQGANGFAPVPRYGRWQDDRLGLNDPTVHTLCIAPDDYSEWGLMYIHENPPPGVTKVIQRYRPTAVGAPLLPMEHPGAIPLAHASHRCSGQPGRGRTPR